MNGLFYNNNNINKIAINILLNNTENTKLVNTIYDSYYDVDTKSINDFSTKNMVENIKLFSNNIIEKGFRTSKDAKDYFEISNLDEDTKEEIRECFSKLPEKAIDEYLHYFGRAKSQIKLRRTLDGLMERFEDYTTSSFSDIKKTESQFFSSSEELFKNIKKLREDTMGDRKDFVIDVDNPENSFGITSLEETIQKEDRNKLYAGTWFDNISKGLKAEQLYLVCGISGGGKSLFLQNLAEEISVNMERSDFEVPERMIPALLFINLEISPRQLIERKIAFYGEDPEYIINGDGSDDDKDLKNGIGMQKRLTAMLKKHNSTIPVIYHTEDSTSRKFTVGQVKEVINRYEQEGFKIVGLFTDYLDKFKFDELNAPSERERDEPIVLKAYDHKDLAKEYKIPVITGAQLNTEAEKVIKDNLKRVDREDILKRVNSSQIGKARALTNVPDQIYFVYKFPVGTMDYNRQHFFGLVVDKDRDGCAEYLTSRTDMEFLKNNPARKSNSDSRVYYITKMPNKGKTGKSEFRIGNDYAHTIEAFIKPDIADQIFDVKSTIDEDGNLRDKDGNIIQNISDLEDSNEPKDVDELVEVLKKQKEERDKENDIDKDDIEDAIIVEEDDTDKKVKDNEKT